MAPVNGNKFKRFTAEEIAIASSAYLRGRTLIEIASELGRSVLGVRKVLLRSGVNLRSKGSRRAEHWHRHKVGDEELGDAISGYEAGQSCAAIARNIGVTTDAVWKLLRNRGIARRGKGEWRAEHRDQNARRVNDRFFDAPMSESNCYWLGFLLADGSVSDRGEVSVSQHMRDVSHIRLLKSEIESEHPICAVNNRPQCVLRFCSRRMSRRLAELECVPRKSCRHGFPSVPTEMERHVIRGLFDGDGCISFDKADRQWRLTLCGSEKCLSAIAELVERATRIKMRLYNYSDNGFAYLKTGGNRMTRAVMDWLYDGATIFLPRKHALYLRMDQAAAIVTAPAATGATLKSSKSTA